MDNGSLRPEPTLKLRALAAELSRRIGCPVHPVSLLHSAKVDPAELCGEPATVLEAFFRSRIAGGVNCFTVLPLFLGPSRAITDYVPQLVQEAQKTCSGLRVRIADPLAGADPAAPDPRLAEMVADQVRRTISEVSMERPRVALVDHGSPVEPVTQVRNAVADQLRGILGEAVRDVRACSMERREGPEYAFNEPLLERVYGEDGAVGGDLVAAMFFLLPGRHAGSGGDVAGICAGLLDRGAFERIRMTGLLAEDPRLLDILEDRLNAAR